MNICDNAFLIHDSWSTSIFVINLCSFCFFIIPHTPESGQKTIFSFLLQTARRMSDCRVESIFVEYKTRSEALGLGRSALTEMLLLAMHTYAARSGLDSIITVVSRAMSRIVRNAGWHYEVLDTGEASPGEKVLLLNMPVSRENDQRLKYAIESKNGYPLA